MKADKSFSTGKFLCEFKPKQGEGERMECIMCGKETGAEGACLCDDCIAGIMERNYFGNQQQPVSRTVATPVAETTVAGDEPVAVKVRLPLDSKEDILSLAAALTTAVPINTK
ncbi:MAG TPA: hypothetical protein VHA30_03600 [Patescibacteria group bacterium]|nr:hypothetical protein [Patescibacteria group bacterium]